MLPNEVPKEWMWPFDDVLESWFDQVSEARRNGMSMPGGDD